MWVEFVVGSLLRFSLLFKNQHLEIPILRVPNGGGGGRGGGEGGSLEPWSPEISAVEPGAQRYFARSPEPSIFKQGG